MNTLFERHNKYAMKLLPQFPITEPEQMSFTRHPKNTGRRHTQYVSSRPLAPPERKLSAKVLPKATKFNPPTLFNICIRNESKERMKATQRKKYILAYKLRERSIAQQLNPHLRNRRSKVNERYYETVRKVLQQENSEVLTDESFSTAFCKSAKTHTKHNNRASNSRDRSRDRGKTIDLSTGSELAKMFSNTAIVEQLNNLEQKNIYVNALAEHPVKEVKSAPKEYLGFTRHIRKRVMSSDVKPLIMPKIIVKFNGKGKTRNEIANERNYKTIAIGK